MPHAHSSQSPSRLALHNLLVYSWAFWGVVLIWLIPQVTLAGSITIGSISLEPAAEVKKFWPLARYLAQQLLPEGVDQGHVVVADSIPQMAAWLREGKVDFYVDSTFPAMAVRRLSGSQVLLRRWKKGVSDYHTVFFTRQDRGLRRLEDLKGHMVAFEKPFSSSGYFLPKMVLVQEGLQVVPKGDAMDPVGPDEVGYVFSAHDSSTMVWVLRGKVAAGAMDDQRFLAEAKSSLPHLQILYETFTLPRQLVSTRATLAPSLVARLLAILTQMDQEEEGRRALDAFEQTTKFDALPEPTMAVLVQLIPFIEAELGLRAP